MKWIEAISGFEITLTGGIAVFGILSMLYVLAHGATQIIRLIAN